MRGILSFLIGLILYFVPPTRFYPLKRNLFRLAGINVGAQVRFVSSARIMTFGPVEIGTDTFIGHECLIIGGEASVKIGAYCDIAPRVMIVTGTHQIDTDGLRVAGEGYSLPITVGDGCWIGAGATLLGGTSIGPRSIIAAGAVVKGEFPPRVLIGGVPARVIRNLI